MKITELDNGNRYQVESDSGNTYTVRYVSGDPDQYDEDIALWECDCPAGHHGRECKHLRAVVSHIEELEAA